MPRELVLVGGGHAHIEVIRRWGLSPIPDARLTVFDPNSRPVYSGMVPGLVAGQYERHQVEIDLKAVSDRAGVDYVERAVARVGPDFLELADGTTFSFHAASLDIGSTVAGVERPGVREFALASRPIGTLISGIGKLAAQGREGAPIHVVGGGAGGVELAFCLDARLRRDGAPGRVELVTSDPVVLEGAGLRLRRRIERALKRRRIGVLASSPVARIRRDAIELATGESIPSAGAMWVTGPASHPLASQSGLPVDARGFARIDSTLRVQDRERLFAVGDCASLPGMKKAGVYAVRAGPVLDHNLRALLRGERLRDYSPQDDFLSLLNLGDGTAIGTKWGLAFEGRAVLWLKDRIDRSFMERY